LSPSVQRRICAISHISYDNALNSMLDRPIICIAAFAICALSPVVAQNPFDNIQRDRARQMLKDVADAMRKHYYDPKYHGIDLEAKVKEADDAIRKASNLSQAMLDVATVLVPLEDSHTFFLPPTRNVRREFGYNAQMVGDHCFVTSVKPRGPASEFLSPG